MEMERRFRAIERLYETVGFSYSARRIFSDRLLGSWGAVCSHFPRLGYLLPRLRMQGLQGTVRKICKLAKVMPTLSDGVPQSGAVRITHAQNGMAALSAQDQFGHAIASVGDLDGDGLLDIAVSANKDDDGGNDRGAVYITFLNEDRSVRTFQKISHTQGGGPALDDEDRFGWAIAAIGDLNSDGVSDLAVSAHRDDDGGSFRGAVHVLFLRTDGTVRAHQKISSTRGGLASGALSDGDGFGSSIALLGDLDGDRRRSMSTWRRATRR